MVSITGRNRWKWENGNPGSQISNNLTAAVGRQEASVDGEVEGHTRHVQAIMIELLFLFQVP